MFCMLRATRKLTGEIVTAYLESKANAPFVCSDCGDKVVLKTGNVRVNYFAHANPRPCRYDAGESEDHRQCKMQIYEALRRMPGVENVALERPMGTNRPDVSAYINGVPVAIEVQISSLSLNTIRHRTTEYARKGIYVLWLLPWTPDLADERYAPKLWEKWIHAAYFGRVYYWIEGLKIVSYRFEPHLQSVPKQSWYPANGEKMTGGGYSRRSTRYRRPVRVETLHLVTDFIPKDREWSGENGFTVPVAKLFLGGTTLCIKSKIC
jgi:competence protein CoiA